MIRLSKKDEGEEFANVLMDDRVGKAKLNYRGGSPLTFVNDMWTMTFVDRQDGEYRAFVKVSANCQDHAIYLDDIYIVKKYRRTGLATRLIQYALSQAKDSWSYDYLYAYTIENKPMENLLRKMGFKNRGTYKKFIYRNGEFLSQTLFMKR